jgi:predicted XRE-type DNA-binding protein
MKSEKRKRLESAGWTVGDARGFLDLTDEEIHFIETKLALAIALKEQRKKKGLTQVQLAKLLRSSQSRVAKMESGDASVSLDLLIRALLLLGLSRRQVASSMQDPAIETTSA